MSKVTKNERISTLENQLSVMQTQISSLIECAHSHTERLIALEPDNPFHGKFYKPERDTATELLEVDLSSELTGSDLTRSILSKQFMQACLVSDSSDKAARQGDDLQLIRMYNETNGKFISMRDPWYGCHHKYAVAVDNNRKPLTASEVGL